MKILTGEMAQEILMAYSERRFHDVELIQDVTEGSLTEEQAGALHNAINDGIFTEKERNELIDNYCIAAGFVDAMRRASGDDITILQNRLERFKSCISLLERPDGTEIEQFKFDIDYWFEYARDSQRYRPLIESALEYIAETCFRGDGMLYARLALARLGHPMDEPCPQFYTGPYSYNCLMHDQIDAFNRLKMLMTADPKIYYNHPAYTHIQTMREKYDIPRHVIDEFLKYWQANH